MKAELSHGQKALLCLGASCVSTPKSSHGGKRQPGPETRWRAWQLSPRRGPGCPSLELCAATVNQVSLVSKTAGVTCSRQTLPPQHPGDQAQEGWRCERHHSLSPTLTATQITTLGITQSMTITAHLQVALSAEEGRPHSHPPGPPSTCRHFGWTPNRPISSITMLKPTGAGGGVHGVVPITPPTHTGHVHLFMPSFAFTPYSPIV